MLHQNFFFLFALLLTSLYAQTCNIDNSDFSNIAVNSANTSPYTLSPQKEIIQGINYGNLIAIGSRVWMMSSPFKLSATFSSFKNPCPLGWELPSMDDFSSLVSVTGSDPMKVLRNSSLFNMSISLYYMSSTKAYPLETSGSVARSWVFYGLKFLATGLPQVAMINSYFSSSSIRAFCVLKKDNKQPSQSGLYVKGIDSKDMVKGLKYVLSINNTNVVDYSWSFGDVNGNSKYLDVIPMKEGSFNLKYKVKLFDGTVIGDCKTVWVRNFTGSEADTTFSLSSIKNVTYPFFKRRNVGIHFNSGNCPLAPKDEGGAYIMYAEKENTFLHVTTIDNNGIQISDYNLTRQGYPFDIISVGWGWVALIKDYVNPNKLYLLGVNTDNNIVFERILINSNSNPTDATSDQLIFYKDAAGTPVFGMNAMFNPSNGKLALGKGRLAVIFAHYNFFGYNSDGTRSDHTGDTLITLDLNGQDEKLAFSWGASHSLTQNIIYNGDKFMTTSLGDAYPLNILFTIEDGLNSNGNADPFTGKTNILEVLETTTLLPDIMTGDGRGYSNGRLGNLMQLADGTTFVVSYARRKSSASLNGFSFSSDINQLGLAFYDENLKLLNDVYLGEGQSVSQVQSCRYGKNIFITYVISNNHFSANGQFLEPEINSDDTQYFMLVDENGNVLQKPLLHQSVGNALSASDEIKMMSDGRCAWTFIDQSYLLNYVYLSPPEQTLTSYIDVQNSQFYNNGDFYLINAYDLKQYKNANVNRESQTFMNLYDVGLSKLSLIQAVIRSDKIGKK